MVGRSLIEPKVWRFAAARAIGTSHLKANLPCQDRFACLVLGDTTLIAAIADGAGSATMAERGAEIAVETTIRLISASVHEGRNDFSAILLEAVADARENILSVARENDISPREFASTLLVTVAGPTGGAALQIGDGVIVASDDEERWDWVFWPQRGEYVNTTRFLTDEDATATLQVKTFAGSLTNLALMTDGLEPLSLNYASMSVHEPFFQGMFRPLLLVDEIHEVAPLSSALERFLASKRVASRTDDDVSLILATCRQNSFKP